ncbi:hypothetical protein EV183_000738 [Coemansia sp. RSA 2336]|nr:hypothetical protein EV183_000738 [Coemansia sp. RSA 2336]
MSIALRRNEFNTDARDGGHAVSSSSSSNQSTNALPMNEHEIAQQLQQLVLDTVAPANEEPANEEPAENAESFQTSQSATLTRINPLNGPETQSSDATWNFLTNAAQMFARSSEISEVTQTEIRRGFDAQGYQWNGQELQRSMYMEYRREVYPQYHGIAHDPRAVRKQGRCVDPTQEFYKLRYSVTGSNYRCKISHFQLRDLIWATSNYDVYYWHMDGIQRWNPWLKTRTCVMGRREMPAGFRLSALCVDQGVMLAGDYQGRVCARPLWTPDAQVAVGQVAGGTDIVNHATPANRREGGNVVSLAVNSGSVDTFDMQRMAVVGSATFEWAVNCTAISDSGSVGCVVGDSLQNALVDPRQGYRRIGELQGHKDYSFACAISPDERQVATGSQDSSVRVYDVRWPRDALASLCGYLGAMRVVKFSSCGRFLLAAEPADYLHVYETGLYDRSQDLEFMGEIAGATFSPDCLFVGISDAVHENMLAEYALL